MKYYVMEVATADGAEARAVTPYDELDNAVMAFHQVMASAYANSAVTHALCVIINSKGGVERSEALERE